MQNIHKKNLVTIADLSPHELWRHFAAISGIPRGSYNEEKVALHIYDLAVSLGYQAIKDRVNNVLVSLPATPGYEHLEKICVQSHTDMVLQPKKDIFPIELFLEGGKVSTNGKSTLGADNGIGVAAMMAIMTDKSFNHGPLELLFTTIEETGLEGAKEFDYSLLEAKIIFNLDTEDWGQFCIGCAGGTRFTGKFKPDYSPLEGEYLKYSITLSGLLGGHSGVEIHLKRANAIKLMAELLEQLQWLGVVMADLKGGNAANAIPSKVRAVIAIPKENLAKALNAIKIFQEIVSKDYEKESPMLRFRNLKFKGNEKFFSPDSQFGILKLLNEIPDGVITMEPTNKNLVQTSSNVGIVGFERGSFAVTLLYRSSVALQIEELESFFKGMFFGNSAINSVIF